MSATTGANGTAYVVVDGDVRRDRERVIGVWRGNLGSGARLAAKYDWFYLQCPWGDPVLQGLRHEPTSQWVGVAAIGPRRMLWQGREIRAGILVDMAVSAAHRSLGPALMLQQRVFDRATADFDLVYGFPNARAVAVVKRVGYAWLGDIVRYSRVLRHAPYLQRLMPRPCARALGWLLDALDRHAGAWRSRRGSRRRVEWRDEVDPRMQDLWERSQPGSGLVAVRDMASVRWRFDHAAFNRARYLLVGARSGDAIEAWYACQVEGAVLHVRDFWSADAPRGVPRVAIDALIQAARADGHSAISIQYAGPAVAFAAWRAARFVERERRPIFGKWRPALEMSAQHGPIHFTPGDEDE